MRLETALKHCLTFPHVTQDLKWGHVIACCIHKKMFAVFSIDEQGKLKQCGFKADPARFLELTDRPGIEPAPYLARWKWVTVTNNQALSDAEAKGLLKMAYDTIVSKLPKRVQIDIGQLHGK